MVTMQTDEKQAALCEHVNISFCGQTADPADRHKTLRMCIGRTLMQFVLYDLAAPGVCSLRECVLRLADQREVCVQILARGA